MPHTVVDHSSGGADLVSAVADLSKDELRARMTKALRVKTAAEGEFTICLAESTRRAMFRDDGATSVEAWTAESFGISVATARAYSQVAEKAVDLPRLLNALCAAEISFDKVRAVVDVATPDTDPELCARAKELSVRELAEVARTAAARVRSASVSFSRSEHEGRYLRFNDGHRTVSMQLPKEAYAQTKACVDAWAKTVPTEDKIPLDQRRCDGFMAMVDSATPGRGPTAGPSEALAAPKPFLVVAHVPLEDLVNEDGEKSELAAELEHGGLIDLETIQRIACDATVVVAVDDAAGHTMYEGRAKRFPTGAQRREVIRRDRQCRFPGCSNGTFAAVHHIVPWNLGGGTDLDNLVLLCQHHHGVVHRNGWSMTGNPNEELRIDNPGGRVTVSRPSVLWTRVTAARTRAAADRSS
jgi:Domain of unknown function (DUF222)/HNH endonuclease